MVVKAVGHQITVLFYPEMPEPESTAYQLCQHLGYGLSNNPQQPFDVAFKYFDATFFSADLLTVFDDIRDEVVNVQSLNVSKHFLGEVFLAVFGYPITIDPTTTQGWGFRKSDINRLRDGQRFVLPITRAEVEDYWIYQKFVDTDIEDYAIDYRVPIYDGLIPTVMVTAQPLDNSSPTHSNDQLKLHHPNELFSEQEQQQLVMLAQKLGLDYGEFDVRRDRHDGNIYVVDVNNTPCEFPQGLPAATQTELLNKLGDAFVPLIAKRL